MKSARYNRKEIVFIGFYLQENGHMTYKDAERLLPEYVQATGCWRPSAGIYMAAWRFEKGAYSNHC